jgi:parvulin-like peptidyl-prolyl isomerase
MNMTRGRNSTGPVQVKTFRLNMKGRFLMTIHDFAVRITGPMRPCRPLLIQAMYVCCFLLAPSFSTAAGEEILLQVGSFSVSGDSFAMNYYRTLEEQGSPEDLDRRVEDTLRDLREQLVLASAGREAGLEEDPSVARLLASLRSRLLSEVYLEKHVVEPARAAARHLAADGAEMSEDELFSRERESRMRQAVDEALAAAGLSVDEEALAAAVEGKVEDAVVARIGDDEIRYSDLVPGMQKVFHPGDSQETMAGVARIVLRTGLTGKVIAMAAEKEGYGGEPRLRERMVLLTARTLADSYLSRNVYSGLKASRDDLESYYEEHREDFRRGREKKIHEIMVGDREKAQRVLDEIKGGGDFAVLVKKYSEGATRENGGFLCYCREGDMVPSLDRAVSGLRAGEFSDIVKSPFGFHVLLCTGESEGRIPPFEEAVREVEGKVMERLRRDAYEGALRQLEGKHIVNFNEELYERIKGGS